MFFDDFHQIGTASESADGKAPAQSLPVSNQIGHHPVVLLRAA